MKSIKISRTGIFLLILASGCGWKDSAPIEFAPSNLKEYLVSDDCPSCEMLKTKSFPNASQITIAGFYHPEFAQTYYVNVDQTRQVVKLRSIRDAHWVFFIYDPYYSGKEGLDVNTQYEQSRCDCGGNRFTLGVALVYYGVPQAENVSHFVLAGQCSLCGKNKILFEN
jgi:hypothetical protein